MEEGLRDNTSTQMEFSPRNSAGVERLTITVSLLGGLGESVVVAEHLAIVRGSFTVLGPRQFVVRVHLKDFEVVPAHRADALLALVCGALHGLVESAQIEVALVVIQHIVVNATLSVDLIVLHEGGDSGL